MVLKMAKTKIGEIEICETNGNICATLIIGVNNEGSAVRRCGSLLVVGLKIA